MHSRIAVWLCLLAATGSQALVADEPVQQPAQAAASHEPNLIDRHVDAQLATANVEPSSRSTDYEFLRRLTQTVIGQLPTPDEVRAFAADTSSDKRTRKIDELLKHPLHAAMWATRFSEWTGNSLDSLAAENETQVAISQLWHGWLRAKFEKNLGYDQLVRAILTATSRDSQTLPEWIDREIVWTNKLRAGKADALTDRATLDLFWRRTITLDEYPTRELAERVASSFLGIRF